MTRRKQRRLRIRRNADRRETVFLLKQHITALWRDAGSGKWGYTVIPVHHEDIDLALQHEAFLNWGVARVAFGPSYTCKVTA